MAGETSNPLRGGGVGGVAAALKFRNRALTILRGTSVNFAGDVSDVGTPLYENVPAALAEESYEAFDYASQTRRTIRTITCVLPAWADIITSDTIYDPSTGYYYLVESMMERQGIGMYPPEKILTLRMRSGVSVQSD